MYCSSPWRLAGRMTSLTCLFFVFSILFFVVNLINCSTDMLQLQSLNTDSSSWNWACSNNKFQMTNIALVLNFRFSADKLSVSLERHQNRLLPFRIPFRDQTAYLFFLFTSRKKAWWLEKKSSEKKKKSGPNLFQKSSQVHLVRHQVERQTIHLSPRSLWRAQNKRENEGET